jgi:two-component system phosphate regulon sensor histidine kinase PhoR
LGNRHTGLIRAAVLPSLPAAAVLLALAAAGSLGWGWAVAAWLACLVAAGLVLRPRLQRIAALEAEVIALRQAPPQAPSPPSWSEAVFDLLPGPLLLLDGARRVVRANPAAARAFGRDPVGRELAAFLRDPQVLDGVAAALAGNGGAEVEFTLPPPVETVWSARIEPTGSGVVLSLHDITGIRRAERMRADFVANASHELRTPLASLLGFIETLRGPAKDDTEAHERFLAIMHEQAGRMSRLIADLLSLSRIELDEHTPPRRQVDLAQLLSTAAQALAPLAAARSMDITVAIADGLPQVAGEPDELAQLFQNLIDNAVKYGHDGTLVEVAAAPAPTLPPAAGRTLRESGAVAVTVRDHGEGIAREHLPRLTERFYRVDTARSRQMGGTGLGLAIVKHIVNRHRGLLTIDSRSGEGSTFTVWLPISAGSR